MENKKKLIAKIELDDWQRRVLDAEGDLCVCAGRQTGKSTVVAIKAAEFIVKNKNKFVIIISTTEDQAILLLNKILDYLESNYKSWIKKGKHTVTKHHIELNNGSQVRTKAAGSSGVGLRGFTVDMLIVDEAALMPEDVWPAVTPMLLTTGGNMILISTPFGRRGYFYESYHSSDFQTFHVNSVEVMNERKITDIWNERVKEEALKRLETERKRMSENEFKQEYLGQFIDDLRQFFPDEVIQQCLNVEKSNTPTKNHDFYLGVDIARMGGDDITFEVVYKTQDDRLVHTKNEIARYKFLTQTFDRIKMLDHAYNFRKIYVDDEGMGIGVFDMLISDDRTKRKTEALRNSRKTIDYRNDRKIKMLKVDLYQNLLRLMERQKIDLLKDDAVWSSLKSVQYEFLEDKKGQVYMHIFSNPHRESHIVEGLIRAAWCAKEKSIKMLVSSFRV